MNRWFGCPASEPFANVCKWWQHMEPPAPGSICCQCGKKLDGTLGFAIHYICQPDDTDAYRIDGLPFLLWHWPCFLENLGLPTLGRY